MQVSDLYKSDLQVSSQFANDLKWKEVKVFANKQGEFIIFGLENFTGVFQKQGEILILKKCQISCAFWEFFANNQGEFGIFDYQSEKV